MQWRGTVRGSGEPQFGRLLMAAKTEKRLSIEVDAQVVNRELTQAYATLAQQVKFLQDVCKVPCEVILGLRWATWRDKAGWTVLHWAAELLNKRVCGSGWLDEIDIEGFVTTFVQRDGDVNAVIRGGADHPGLAGQAALHMVAHRHISRIEEHEHNVCRFAKALIVQGRANADLAQRNPVYIK